MISYGEAADEILVTCRARRDAAPATRCMVLVRKEDYTARAALRVGHAGLPRHVQLRLRAEVAWATPSRSCPAPFAEIHAQDACTRSRTSSGRRSGSGIATDALSTARALRARRGAQDPGRDCRSPPCAWPRPTRAEHDAQRTLAGHARRLPRSRSPRPTPRPSRTSASRSASTTSSSPARSSWSTWCMRAMLICGIAGYRNDSQAHARPPPARRLRRGADGQQRPHPRPERDDARRRCERPEPCADVHAPRGPRRPTHLRPVPRASSIARAS